jgi:mediator of RNA polymerase II transcription subunit 8
VHVYPLPAFPGHTQEALLQQLLRKKLEPGVEKWVEDHTTATTSNGDNAINNGEWRDLWSEAASMSQGVVGPMLEEDGAFGEDFTIAETEAGVENVVTGLRRKMWESDSEDEDDEGEIEGSKMEDVMPTEEVKMEEGVDPTLPPLSLEAILKFTATGERPPELRMGGR